MTRYAEIENVEALAMASASIASISEADKNACLDAASSEADVLMSSRHATPLTEWPLAVTLHVAKMAAFHMMSVRGYRPTGFDELIRLGYEDGRKFFEMVGKGKPGLPVSQTAPAATGTPSVTSDDQRWPDC